MIFRYEQRLYVRYGQRPGRQKTQENITRARETDQEKKGNAERMYERLLILNTLCLSDTANHSINHESLTAFFKGNIQDHRHGKRWNKEKWSSSMPSP